MREEREIFASWFEREWKLVVYSAVFLRLATPKLFPEHASKRNYAEPI